MLFGQLFSNKKRHRAKSKQPINHNTDPYVVVHWLVIISLFKSLNLGKRPFTADTPHSLTEDQTDINMNEVHWVVVRSRLSHVASK